MTSMSESAGPSCFRFPVFVVIVRVVVVVVVAVVVVGHAGCPMVWLLSLGVVGAGVVRCCSVLFGVVRCCLVLLELPVLSSIPPHWYV